MHSTPGWETTVYVVMIKRYFHRQKLLTNLEAGTQIPPLPQVSSGVFWTRWGLEVISAGHRKSRFHRRARKLDNLAAGWGSGGNVAALFSYVSSKIDTFVEEQDFYVKYLQILPIFSILQRRTWPANKKSILRRLQRLRWREDTLIDILWISVG